jgi:hypothetical protein
MRFCWFVLLTVQEVCRGGRVMNEVLFVGSLCPGTLYGSLHWHVWHSY